MHHESSHMQHVVTKNNIESNHTFKQKNAKNPLLVDSKRGHRAASSSRRDLPELPKASRRNSSAENDSPRKKDSSTRSRQSRRNQPKDSPDGSGAPKSGQDSGPTVPDIPRKSRRKKSKESDGGGSTRSRSKGTTSNGISHDAGPDSGLQTPNVHDGETEIRGNSKE
ncbi:hypothetical protein CDL12_22681 [Handroanthus impetiginosus]|uniref:Uncharacterized protein n=1 Tax=Handroanthus impetiginosus TaxID=429701 RepID=A0A2G9GHV6_9LAMI|nr:hypothetical protein CDL12_22681 [Handroanthus impetiginosus]